MKKVIMAATACLMFLGCVSTSTLSPLLYTDNARKDFTILGEISYEVSNRGGYTELLAEAKKKYPGCDYVIDVMIDSKSTVQTILFWKTDASTTYVVRATAIKYNQGGAQSGFSQPAE